jgi:uncharacterized delta-60 repeat protein
MVLGLVMASATLAAASIGPGIGLGASSSTVVTMQVPSATSLNVLGCPTNGPATAFGVVQPGTTAVTGAPCTVTWGSSNDTSMLRLFQEDRRGNAMYRLSDGTFDNGFNTDGVADGVNVINPTAIAYDNEGRTLIAGWYEPAGDKVLAFTRLNPDGSPDLSCDTDGQAHVNITVGQWDNAWAIAVDDAGNILVGGGAGAFAEISAVVARFNESDCSLDTTFGVGGVATPATGGGNRIYAIDVTDDGRILLGGINFWGAGLYRLRTDGQLDTTFSGDGVLQTSGDYLDVHTLRDGRIAAVGYDTAATQDAFVELYSAAGVADPGFNGGSRLTLTTAGGNDQLRAVDETPDGKLVVAGSTHRGVSAELHVARILMNGTLDTTFNGTGEVVRVLAGDDVYRSVIAHGDGRVSAIGNVATGDDVFVARFNPDGSYDATLDGDGMLVTGTGPGTGGFDSSSPGVIGNDGSYLVAGNGTPARALKLASKGVIADYQDTVNDWNAGASMIAACLSGTTGLNITATWTPAGTCDGIDTDPWYPIAVDGAGPTAKVAATTVSGTVGSQAHLRFGVRMTTGQAPDRYLAPLAFEVVAPAA